MNKPDYDPALSSLPFPQKLHALLDYAERTQKADIVSWMPDGKTFRVHNRKAFEREIIPVFFRQTQYRSFMRQLYLYGFVRGDDASGNDKGGKTYMGAYGHPLFCKDDKDLALKMNRKKSSSSSSKKSSRREAPTALAHSSSNNNNSIMALMEWNTDQEELTTSLAADIGIPYNSSITTGRQKLLEELFQPVSPGDIFGDEEDNDNDNDSTAHVHAEDRTLFDVPSSNNKDLAVAYSDSITTVSGSLSSSSMPHVISLLSCLTATTRSAPQPSAANASFAAIPPEVGRTRALQVAEEMGMDFLKSLGEMHQL